MAIKKGEEHTQKWAKDNKHQRRSAAVAGPKVVIAVVSEGNFFLLLLLMSRKVVYNESVTNLHKAPAMIIKKLSFMHKRAALVARHLIYLSSQRQ